MSAKPVIKVGFLISYDYAYVKDALPRVYPYADYIAFAIDKDRKTWSGESFVIPDPFFDWVKEFDTENKIHIYEDSFCVPTFSGVECETRERTLLGQFMGDGGWHIQVDADEYFFDFHAFVNYLYSLDVTKKIQVYAKWITMYNKDGKGYYIINTNENFPVATSNPRYSMCRLSENPEDSLYTDFKVLHQSWARGDAEILQKLRNWGHKTDFDVNSYYNFWKSIDKQTYKYIRSFHPLDPWLWPSLEYFEAKDITELINKVDIYLKEESERKQIENKLRIRDFIPVALYKIKARFSK